MEEQKKAELIDRNLIVKDLLAKIEAMPLNSDYCDAKEDGINASIKAIRKAELVPDLRAENERLREALRTIETQSIFLCLGPDGQDEQIKKTIKELIDKALNP